MAGVSSRQRLGQDTFVIQQPPPFSELSTEVVLVARETHSASHSQDLPPQLRSSGTALEGRAPPTEPPTPLPATQCPGEGRDRGREKPHSSLTAGRNQHGFQPRCNPDPNAKPASSPRLPSFTATHHKPSACFLVEREGCRLLIRGGLLPLQGWAISPPSV